MTQFKDAYLIPPLYFWGVVFYILKIENLYSLIMKARKKMKFKNMIGFRIYVIPFLTIFLTACDSDSPDSTMVDKTPPVITILGENPTSLMEGGTYIDSGATAVDAVDGVVSVSSTGQVNPVNIGDYVITYTATDSSGNTGTKTRTVSVLPMDDQEKLGALEDAGIIPRLERNATLEGVDDNANGVRDDIDQYIQTNYPKKEHVSSLTQMAISMQQTLLVDINDRIAVKKANQKVVEAINCIYSKFDRTVGEESPASASAKIESLTTNTKQRLLGYLAYNKALDGTSWATPDGDTCE